jgi:hypothetical protein
VNVKIFELDRKLDDDFSPMLYLTTKATAEVVASHNYPL